MYQIFASQLNKFQVIKRVEEGFFSKTLLFTLNNDTPFVNVSKNIYISKIFTFNSKLS